MTMCPICDYVYDESEYARCPKCAKRRKPKIKWRKFKSRRR